MSEGLSRLALVCVLGALSGCGQKGPLYLPDEASEVVTRPTQTPPPAPQGSNGPQSPDAPAQPASAAPEVTPDEKRDQKPGTTPPPR